MIATVDACKPACVHFLVYCRRLRMMCACMTASRHAGQVTGHVLYTATQVQIHECMHVGSTASNHTSHHVPVVLLQRHKSLLCSDLDKGRSNRCKQLAKNLRCRQLRNSGGLLQVYLDKQLGSSSYELIGSDYPSMLKWCHKTYHIKPHDRRHQTSRPTETHQIQQCQAMASSP